MKTNQLISVKLGRGTIQIGHLDLMGNLNDVLAIGQKMRIEEHKPIFNMAQFLKKKSTLAFIEELKVTKGIEIPVKVIGKGGSRKTRGHLYFIIYMAQMMSDRFMIEVIDVFIHSQILRERDDGGNAFKKLNLAIDTLPDRNPTLKPKGNRGCYINTAKALRTVIFTEEQIKACNGNIWNSSVATLEQQKKRKEVEEMLVRMIEFKMIKSYPQLKEVIHGL